MARKATARGTIAIILPIMFLFFLLVLAPAMFSSAEDAHPAAETDHPDEVAGINEMFRSGSYILPALIIILALGMVFTAFYSGWLRI